MNEQTHASLCVSYLVPEYIPIDLLFKKKKRTIICLHHAFYMKKKTHFLYIRLINYIHIITIKHTYKQIVIQGI